jgi:hypothetical protein
MRFFVRSDRKPDQVADRKRGLFWLRADERAGMNPVAKAFWFIESHL